MYAFKVLSALALSAAAFITGASAISYHGYASTVSCSGSSFTCSDGGGVCCSFPSSFGFSAQFDSLPAGTQGQGYSGSGCTAFVFSVFGPGTKCWNGGGGTTFSHLNWFHDSQKREIGAADTTGADCAIPDVFSYEDGTGAARQIEVPAGGANATETIANLYLAKNFEALGQYETHA